jgi:flagellar L-ring protein precursor FlgH
MILTAACGFASAQTSANQPAPNSKTNDPNNPPPTPAELMQRGNGSLLRATLTVGADPAQAKISGVSFFAVPEPLPRLIKKHDLVTIIVREESEFKSEGTTDLKKDAELEAKIEEFIKINQFKLTGGGVTDPVPSVKLSGSRNMKGEATVDRTDTLTLRVTAEVVDVKPNGTLVLQARQRIQTDDEVQTFVLSGVCRVDDVTPDNTILSTQMFDKNVTKSHTGAVRDTTKRGWLTKLLDVINPF